LASILLPVLVFALVAWESYRDGFRAAESRGAHIAGLLEEHALKTLETVALVLKQTDLRLKGVDWDTMRSSRELWTEIKAVKDLTDQVDAIFVVSPDGQNPLTTRVFPATTVDFSDRDYLIAQAEADRGVYIGQSYTGRISGRPIFNLSIRRSSPDGAFNGVIGSSAFVDYFETFYAGAGAREDAFAIVLVREDGMPLVGFPHIDNRRTFDPDATFARVPGATEGSFTTRSPDTGIERIYSYKKVGGFPVYVLYGIDRSTIVAAWRGHLVLWGLITLGVWAVLFSTSWLALQRARQAALAVARWQKTSADLLQEIDRRKRAESALLQAQKLEAVGQLTGGIAHDFNNLLTVIGGNLERADRKSDVASIRKLHASMRYATQRAEALTRQLLAFSRRQSLRPRTIDMNDVIKGGSLLTRRAVGESVEVEYALGADLRPVRIDPGQFESALLNLVVNARDAMPRGGRLVISTENVVLTEAECAECFPTLRPGSYVRLRVRDTGSGMPPEILARVFEPFFTTKDIGKGTGLGMSQIYGFVQQSGGAIRLDSTMGEGTTVTVLFPPSAEPVAERHDDTMPDAEATGSELILVVEDDEEVREVVVGTLHDLGYRTLVARTATEALALLRGGARCDLLLSDIVMPGGMDGFELARAARQEAPGIRVLLMSGYMGHIVEAAAIDLPVVSKPFTRSKLGLQVRAALDAVRGDAGRAIR
jgi:two-component system NtrC family sensor kinase